MEPLYNDKVETESRIEETESRTIASLFFLQSYNDCDFRPLQARVCMFLPVADWQRLQRLSKRINFLSHPHVFQCLLGPNFPIPLAPSLKQWGPVVRHIRDLASSPALLEPETLTYDNWWSTPKLDSVFVSRGAERGWGWVGEAQQGRTQIWIGTSNSRASFNEFIVGTVDAITPLGSKAFALLQNATLRIFNGKTWEKSREIEPMGKIRGQRALIHAMSEIRLAMVAKNSHALHVLDLRRQARTMALSKWTGGEIVQLASLDARTLIVSQHTRITELYFRIVGGTPSCLPVKEIDLTSVTLTYHVITTPSRRVVIGHDKGLTIVNFANGGGEVRGPEGSTKEGGVCLLHPNYVLSNHGLKTEYQLTDVRTGTSKPWKDPVAHRLPLRLRSVAPFEFLVFNDLMIRHLSLTAALIKESAEV